jgi:hypothetical protein
MKRDITKTISNTGYARRTEETRYPVSRKSVLSLHNILTEDIIHYETDPTDKYVVYDLRTKDYGQVLYTGLDPGYHLIYMHKSWWYVRKFASILPKKGDKKNES